MSKVPNDHIEAPEPTDILFVLEREDHVTETSRRLVERYMRTWSCSALDALIRTHVMPEAELANALASILKIDRVYHINTLTFADVSLAVLPFRRAREWVCLVVRQESGQLELVIADPTRTDRISEIKQGLKMELTLSVAERSDIVRAIDELYPLSAQLPSLYGSANSEGRS